MAARPFLVGGVPRGGAETFAVRNPYNGETVAEVTQPAAGDLEAALETVVRAFQRTRRLPAWRRAAPLAEAARRLEADRERFARTIAMEAGKPIVQARGEVERAVETFRTSAEEARRVGGEVLPLDAARAGESRLGITLRFPVGPVACITPFNFPLNLVAHKIAPALAAGCPFVLKPASATPLSALDLAALLLEAGATPEAVNVLPLSGADAAPLAEDPRIRALSFTGSAEVGWKLKRRAYRKKVVLELGGNAGLIVDRTADLERAAARTVAGGFHYAGQSCISVQRVFVHREIRDSFLKRVLSGVAKLVTGDPLDEATVVGPMIREEDARRAESWIAEAVEGGARVLAGGKRKGAILEPTVLTGTRPEMKVRRLEVFAPVIAVEEFSDLEEAIREADRSDYGLQAGIFTRDLAAAFAAFRGIEVGGLVVNDAPTFRVDPMPYGGVKASGTGREGPRYAVEDYTEPRLMVLDPGNPG